jgi:hypothetical protein
MAIMPIKSGAARATNDSVDDAARVLIKANTGLSIRTLVQLLEDSGIKRQKTWVSEERMKLRGVMVTDHD